MESLHHAGKKAKARGYRLCLGATYAVTVHELDRLALRNFRNYERLESSFSPGVNLIVGDNAQGKTNLLEAVFYLSTGRSFRPGGKWSSFGLEANLQTWRGM